MSPLFPQFRVSITDFSPGRYEAQRSTDQMKKVCYIQSFLCFLAVYIPTRILSANTTIQPIQNS